MSFIKYDGVQDKARRKKEKRLAKRSKKPDEDLDLDWLPPACLGIFVLVILFILYSTMAAAPKDATPTATGAAGDATPDMAD